MSKVKCKVCNNEYHSLVSHIRRHNLTPDEYKVKYPGSELESDEYKASRRNMLAERNKSDKMKQVTADRNKSDHMRQVVSKRNSDPEFKLKVREGYTRPEVAKARSEHISKLNKSRWENDEYRSRMSKLISDSQRKISTNSEVKERKRQVMYRNWSNPKLAMAMINSHKSSPFGKPVTYYSSKYDKSYRFRSQGEYEMMIALEKLDATEVTYEEYRVRYTDSLGNTRVYIPDFKVLLDGVTYIIEVKYSDEINLESDKVIGALRHCEEKDYKYCWVRRYVELKYINEHLTLTKSIVQSK